MRLAARGAIAASLFGCLAANSAANAQPAIESATVLRAGTPVPLVTLAEISSKTHKQGDRFELAVSEDVLVDGQVAIPRNARAIGEVAEHEFNAIITAPQSAAMAIGGVRAVPVVKDGQVVPGQVMKFTVSADHRVTDGAVNAEFCVEVKNLLENPMRLLI